MLSVKSIGDLRPTETIRPTPLPAPIAVLIETFRTAVPGQGEELRARGLLNIEAILDRPVSRRDSAETLTNILASSPGFSETNEALRVTVAVVFSERARLSVEVAGGDARGEPRAREVARGEPRAEDDARGDVISAVDATGVLTADVDIRDGGASSGVEGTATTLVVELSGNLVE